MADYNSIHTGQEIDSAITAVQNKESTWDGKLDASQKGAAGGVASLGSDGKVPSGQLPEMDYVPTSRKVNGKALSADITLAAGDVGAAAASHNHSASDINSGTLSVARGGTGKASWTANRLIYPSSSTALTQLAFPTSSGSVLRQGTSGAPYWSSLSSLASDLSGVQIATGTYAGTGSKTKSLTTPFVISFLIISGSYIGGSYPYTQYHGAGIENYRTFIDANMLTTSDRESICLAGSQYRGTARKSSDGKTITWTINSNAPSGGDAFNGSGYTYYWIAVGK